jgi:hypothetical protein
MSLEILQIRNVNHWGSTDFQDNSWIISGTLCQHLVAARYPHKIGVQYILPTGLLAACYTTVRSSIATVTTVRCIVHVRTAGAPQVLIVFQLTFLLLFLVDGMQLGNSIKRHSTYSSLSPSVRLSVCLSLNAGLLGGERSIAFAYVQVSLDTEYT